VWGQAYLEQGATLTLFLLDGRTLSPFALTWVWRTPDGTPLVLEGYHGLDNDIFLVVPWHSVVMFEPAG
jgi:hypothetical protein